MSNARRDERCYYFLPVNILNSQNDGSETYVTDGRAYRKHISPHCTYPATFSSLVERYSLHCCGRRVNDLVIQFRVTNKGIAGS